MVNRQVCFGPFRFDPNSRVLWDGNERTRIGARAIAILDLLMKDPGSPVAQMDLIQAAWPGLHVDRSNLRVQIYALRKVLRDQGKFIQPGPSHTYCFVGDATFLAPSDASSAYHGSPSIPAPSVSPVGRDRVISSIRALCEIDRLVTILGSGGIGKTTVALQFAHEQQHQYRAGACFVDLGRLSDPNAVNAMVASAAGFSVTEWPSTEYVAQALSNKHMLLVLDCCEHVLESVSALVETLLRTAPSIRILLTTRQPTGIAGEQLFVLEPLPIPPPMTESSAGPGLATYASVQLLIDGVKRRGAQLEITDDTSTYISEICRRAEGVPLTIELTASMVAVLGLHQVAEGLADGTQLLSIDRRSTVPRQRSLSATIEWSYNLLTDEERYAIQCLSCFAGWFSIVSGVAVVEGPKLDAEAARHAILGLAHKSLLASDTIHAPSKLRLLDTTRAFVLKTPDPVGDRSRASERHARYLITQLDLIEWDTFDPHQYAGLIDEIRIALDWAFANSPHLGVALVLSAERLWLELTSLFHGAQDIFRALQHVDLDPRIDKASRARLLVSLASAQAYLPGLDDASLYERAWRAARDANDHFLQLRALYGIIQNLLLTRRPADFHLDAFATASERSSHPSTRHLHQRMSAFNAFEGSELRLARTMFEAFLSDAQSIPKELSLYFGGIGPKASAKVGLALTQYYLGYCDDAQHVLDSAVEEAKLLRHATTSYFVFAQGAIWVKIHSGDFACAHAYLDELEHLAESHLPWRTLVDGFRGLIARYEHNDPETACRLLGTCLDQPYIIKTGSLHPILWVELADARRLRGDLAGAEDALNRSKAQLRGDIDVRLLGKHHPVLAQVLLARGRAEDIERARMLLREARELSILKEFYLYECEATIILAQLETHQGNAGEARHLLQQLASRFEDRQSVPGFDHAQTLLKAIDAGAPS